MLSAATRPPSDIVVDSNFFPGAVSQVETGENASGARSFIIYTGSLLVRNHHVGRK